MQSVWPDWAIFENACQKCLTKVAQWMFGLFSKNLVLCKNLRWPPFGNNLAKVAKSLEHLATLIAMPRIAKENTFMEYFILDIWSAKKWKKLVDKVIMKAKFCKMFFRYVTLLESGKEIEAFNLMMLFCLKYEKMFSYFWAWHLKHPKIKMFSYLNEYKWGW